MERQLLIAATLVAALASGTGALADCAEELAQLTQHGSTAPMPDPGTTGEGEDEDGGTFAAWGQEEAGSESKGLGTDAQANSGSDAGSSDRAAALKRAQAALDDGDEAACMEAVEDAKAM
jgi:hypothetical protein